MPRIVMFLLALCIGLTADMETREPGQSWLATALADDDDDDDDDDGPRRLRVQPRRAPAPVAPPPAQATDEILARGLSDGDVALLQDRGFEVLRRTTLSDGTTMLRLRKPADLSMDQAREAVRDSGSAPAADFNHFYRPEQGACQTIDCPARDMIGWQDSYAQCGGIPPLIGMVDTGLNESHEVFAGAMIEVHRIDGQEGPDRMHGTAVAALLVGRRDSRSPGLVPHARLVAVDAFHKAGNDLRADAFALIEAMDLLAQRGAKVVNLSLAGPRNAALERQVVQLHDRGVVMVAAAGNDGPRAEPAYPAGYGQVIAVTAVDRRGEVYRRAIRGEHIDLAAPGVDVWTAASVSGARVRTGTSFAAPFVTAAAALLLQRDPQMTPDQVRQALLSQASDLGPAGRDEIFGYGLVGAPADCTAPQQAG